MKNSRNALLPVPVEKELKGLIEDAAHKTHLSQAAVMRAALRIGVPEVVKRLEGRKRPRRNFAEYLGMFAGVVHRNRELVKPSRFK
jgi:hypothetical protein